MLPGCPCFLMCQMGSFEPIAARDMVTIAPRAGAMLRDIELQGGWRHGSMVVGCIEEAILSYAQAAGKSIRSRNADDDNLNTAGWACRLSLFPLH